MFFKLALKSLISRKSSALLTLLAMTVSVFVLLAVEHIRYQAKDGFSSTVSGVDLIVGARTGSLNLLLYSVFRVGSPTNNIQWSSYDSISKNRHVKWAIPISLGDSHKGYRVMGTSVDYFEYFSYGNKHKLKFESGQAFNSIFEVVIGAEVADRLNYAIGDQLVLSHGIVSTGFNRHDDRPFTIVGILAATGTPVDQTLHVSLEGIEAIHVDWKNGVRMPGRELTIDQIEQLDLKPKSITAMMIGLNSRMATFGVQRTINNFKEEPLMAILPGVALSELWQMMSVLENTLRVISGLVLVASLLGLSAMLLASIRERDHEVQLLRVMGAPPYYLFFLIQLEAVLITLFSIMLGMTLLILVLLLFADSLASQYGVYLTTNVFTMNIGFFIFAIFVSTAIIAAIPSFSLYRSARSI